MKNIGTDAYDQFSAEVEEARILYATAPEKAFLKLKEFAERGSVRSMVLLGGIFRDGISTEKDFVQSEFWYDRAIKAGSVKAIYYLGDLFWRIKEYKKAEDILLFGNEKNYPPAIYCLTKFYIRAPMPYRDNEKGLFLLDRASKFGHIFARRDLAGYLMRGRKGFFARARGVFLVFSSSPYPANAGTAAMTGSRRLRVAPPTMPPVLSWS